MNKCIDVPQLDTCGSNPIFLIHRSHHRRQLRSDQMGSSPDPLANLSSLQSRMEALHNFLSSSVNSATLLGQPQMNMISSEINSAIRQIIVSGTALLSSSQFFPIHDQIKEEIPDPESRIHVDDGFDDFEIVELDAVELLAEHVHFCEICGKGFKRDANLRMHMRAHGNHFKTPEALSKPEKGGARVRFSCPYVGCNRNKQHKKFRPLKSVICVKNHFKRSHCPKVYSCDRCKNKSFSVVADLKSHLKHCGESKWRCCCGTSFSRKDKLFGHMVLFEGHMPAMADDKDEQENGKSSAAAASLLDDFDDEDEFKDENDVFDGLVPIDDYCFQDVLNSPNSGFFDF